MKLEMGEAGFKIDFKLHHVTGRMPYKCFMIYTCAFCYNADDAESYRNNVFHSVQLLVVLNQKEIA